MGEKQNSLMFLDSCPGPRAYRVSVSLSGLNGQLPACACAVQASARLRKKLSEFRDKHTFTGYMVDGFLGTSGAGMRGATVWTFDGCE